MVDITAIGSALTALKAAMDIAEAMVGLRDTAAFQGKLIEFQSKIIDANNAAFAAQEERSALLSTIGELEKQVADLEAWETQKDRYSLTKHGDRDVFTYALKEGMGTSEPPHQICANCFNDKKISVLQAETFDLGRARVLVCHRCDSVIYISGMRMAEHTRGRGRR